MMKAFVLVTQGSGDGAHCVRMNPMIGVLISLKRVETVFSIKHNINPDYSVMSVYPHQDELLATQ